MSGIFIYEFRKPALSPGNYSVKLDHKFLEHSFEEKLPFKVEGFRHFLPPEYVHALSPPQGFEGNYENYLPHIVISLENFPWERSPDSPSPETPVPWVFLACFSEKEMQEKVIELVIENKVENRIERQVEIEESFLLSILPPPEKLKVLCHGRDMADGKKVSVVVGNRLPAPGEVNVVLLLSLEGCFGDNNTTYSFTSIQGNVVLHSLFKWTFKCTTGKETTLKDLINQLEFKKLGGIGSAEADEFLEMGFFPYKHFSFDGQETWSWYHGPLIHGILNFPINEDKGDQKAKYLGNTGMKDISWQLAYSLGQMLAMNDPNFATTLFRWKKWYRQKEVREESGKFKNSFWGDAEHKGIDPADHPDENGAILEWLGKLFRLENIPFNYLVPGENLLPEESLRFCHIDRNWMRAIVSGALSIGGTLKDKGPIEKMLEKIPESRGFLLRSKAVSAFPDLSILAFKAGEIVDPIRVEVMGPDIMLGIYPSDPDTLRLFGKPEGMHYEKGAKDEMHDNRTLDLSQVTRSIDFGTQKLKGDNSRVEFSIQPHEK